ncbi:MAG: histidine kinase [Bacteroidetes bacterium]|nr:histidine kinase [Bacteroidota bacterium]
MQRCLLFLCFLFTANWLPAQSWYFEQFSVAEGLPQSQVYALLQDSRGYLWLGTQGGGLARFDGRTFTVPEGQQSGYVQALLEAGDGRLWVGTNQGVSRFDGRTFRHFELEKDKDVPVFALATDRQQTLWIAANTGILGIHHDSVFQVAHIAGTPVGRMTAAFADSRGIVWMGGDELLCKLENGIWSIVQQRKAEVLAFAETADGKILAAIFNSGIFVLDGNRRNFINAAQGLCSNKVQSLWRAPDGKIWVGTQDAGVCLLDLAAANKFQQPSLGVAQGLCSQNVRAITGDRNGNVWLGTSGGGLCRFGGQEFEHFDTGNGLRSNNVYALCADTSGGIWLSAGDRGLSFLQNNTLRHYGPDSGFLNIKCRAMLKDRAGRLWIGTEGAGVAVRANGVFHFFTKDDGLAGNWIRDIAEDATGNLWVATTDGGISRLTVNDPASGSLFFKNFGSREGLPDRNVQALHPDRRGRLWFATEQSGVGFIENSRLKMLPAGSGLPQANIRCLAEDTLGYLWAGTAGRGIGYAQIYDDKPLVFNFLPQNSLTSANIYQLQFDPLGKLWVGTEKGLDRLTLDAARQVAERKYFGRAEGFKGIETCQNATLLDPVGNLWFGTMGGLTRHRPTTDADRTAAPPPYFTGIRLFYEPLENSAQRRWADGQGGLLDGAVLPWNQNHLGFEFYAVHLSNPDKVEYAWQLVGQETDWSPFSDRHEVSYANLPHGNYTFRVRSRYEGAISDPPLAVSFVIGAPFWQTLWFRLLAGGAVAAMIFCIFKWRLKVVKDKAAAERQQLELQNRLLTLEQKARQLQMNPHFIFNALNSIQSLVTAGEMDTARQYILKFGRLMRAVLDNSRQALIPLDKEVETLRQYLEMEQFCRPGKFDFELKTSGVSSDDLQIPPMILQPFVENAILHGVAPLAGRKGEIELEFMEHEAFMEVFIRDNGIGFARSQALQGEKTRQSAGIEVTKERLALMEGGGEVAIEDLAVGTEVRVKIPLTT